MSSYEPLRGEPDAAFPETVDDSSPEDERVPDPEEPALPGDTLLGAEAFGTTEEEQELGESLDYKLDREEPEEPRDPGSSEVASPRAGRLVDPDEGAHSDDEATLVARETGVPGDASPEEAAMHIEEIG